jgi:hypothetical protein
MLPRMFAFQGYDEFYINGLPNGPLVGWHDAMIAAGAGFETGFHDDDHKITSMLKKASHGNANYKVRLQGVLPAAVLNASPRASHSYGKQSIRKIRGQARSC